MAILPWAAATVAMAPSARPSNAGMSLRIMVSPWNENERDAGARRGESGLAADVQEAAAFFAGLPGIGLKLEAGLLEGAVVHEAGDPAQRFYALGRELRVFPGFLERTGVELDVQALVVAAHDLGVEQLAVVGNEIEEAVAQAGKVGGRVGLE